KKFHPAHVGDPPPLAGWRCVAPSTWLASRATGHKHESTEVGHAGSCQEGMTHMNQLLASAADRGLRYLAGLKKRSVAPTAEAISNLRRFDEALPQHSTDPATVIAQLDEVGSPATMATAGGRYLRVVVCAAPP